MAAWIVHDTRTSGFLTAAVLAHGLLASGKTVRFVGGRAPDVQGIEAPGIVTEKPEYFWTDGIRRLKAIVTPADDVYLCCLSLWEGRNQECRGALDDLRQAVAPNGNLHIFSDRWPDSYDGIGVRSGLVPFDLVQASDRDLYVRDLAELIFTASHHAAPCQSTSTERRIVNGLAQTLADCYEQQRSICDQRNDIYDPAWQLLTELVSEGGGRRRLAEASLLLRTKVAMLSVPIVSDKAYVFEMPPAQLDHRPDHLRAALRELTADPGAIAIAFQPRGSDYRAFIVRPNETDIDRPSLWRLIGEPPPAYGWVVVGENTLLFVSELAADGPWAKKDRGQLSPMLQDWVRGIINERTGDAPTPAILSRVLHEAGRAALKQLDLLHRHVPRSLRFEPQRALVRLDRSNRADPSIVRSTLLLTLTVETAEAAAFLLRGDGYVLLRLETMLEGVRIGLTHSGSEWLWPAAGVDRVRINTVFSAGALDGLLTLLSNNIEPVNLRGIAPVLAESESVIGKALTAASTRRVIVFRETEMIGPSVQYARLCGALSRTLSAKQGQQQLRVLDLFSGSGYSALTVKAACPNALIFCVDSFIPQPMTLVKNRDDIVWLRSAVEDVIGRSGHEGITQGAFDVVMMDPPHAALLGMLLSGLLPRIRRRTDWLVIYQGHTSQSGRGRAVREAVGRRFDRTTLVVIDSEEVLIAGPAHWVPRTLAAQPRRDKKESFETVVRAACGQLGHGHRVLHGLD